MTSGRPVSNMGALAAFLRARLAERKALAEEYLDSYDRDPRWRGWRVEAGELVTAGGKVVIAAEAGLRPELLALIAASDPWTVLADVEARRQVVDHAESWSATLRQTPEGWTTEACTAYRMAMEWTLHLLALPHAAHPDHRPEWKP
jgi:hypothetical protein